MDGGKEGGRKGGKREDRGTVFYSYTVYILFGTLMEIDTPPVSTRGKRKIIIEWRQMKKSSFRTDVF